MERASDDARDTLKSLAKTMGARTSRALMQYRGQDTFDLRLHFKHDKRRVEMFANAGFLYVDVKRPSGVVFSTPVADPLRPGMVLQGQVAGRPVYAMANGQALPGKWLETRATISALTALEIAHDELLSVAVDGVVALLRTQGVEQDEHRLRALLAFVDLLPQVGKSAVPDPNKLPIDLRHLGPLLSTWGITDDDARSDLIEEADNEMLADLVGQVTPMMPAIRRHLRNVQFAAGDEGVATDALAQAAMEAQIEIRRRNSIRER